MVDLAVRRRIGTTVLALAIVALGLFAAPRLLVTLLPAFQPPVISVLVTYGTVAPDTMESQVTRPIEKAVSRVAGIEYVQSESYEGLSVVRVQFRYGTDINASAADMQQQISRLGSLLPSDPALGQPLIVKSDPNALPLFRIYVTDANRSTAELSDLFANQLVDEISAVRGVASVTITDSPQRAMIVSPDFTRLSADDLSLTDLVTALQRDNRDAVGGNVTFQKSTYLLRASYLFRSAADIGNAVVALDASGGPVHVRDVAAVRDSVVAQQSLSRLNGRPAIGINITPQPDANILASSRAVARKLAELQQRYPSMHVAVVLEQDEFIEQASRALEHTILYAGVLAVLVVFFFLRSYTATAIVTVSLPASVLGVLFLGYLFGHTINLMTLGGLALAIGLIVDDAVVVMENVDKHRRAGKPLAAAALDGTREVFGAVLVSTLTVVIVFVPLFLIPGIQSNIFGPFAFFVIGSVGISFFAATALAPMLAAQARLQPRTARPHRGAAWARVDGAYRSLLTAALARPVAVLGAAVLVLAVSLVAVRLGLIKTDVFPADPSRFARFDLRTPSGTSFEETSRVSDRLERALRTDPRVQDVTATVGLALDGAAARVATNRSFVSVTLRPGIYGHATERFLLDWKRRVGADRQFAGATVRGRAIDILQQTLSQGADALEVQLYGPDVARLYALGQAAAQQLAAVPGIVRPDTNIALAQPELDLSTDRLRLAQLHLTPADVSLALQAATSGVVAGNYQRGSSEYPIVVQIPPSGLRTNADLARLELMAQPGAEKNAALLRAVSFAQLGALHAGIGPSQISRQGGQRRVDVDAALVGVPLGTALGASSAIMSAFPLPPGYRWQFGPEVTRYADTYKELALTIFLAIVLVFFLLAAFFDAFFEPLLILIAVPFATVGVVLSLWLTQRSFGLTATIGCLMLVGITVKNAVLLVDRIRALRLSGHGPREAVLLAAPSRLRPIVMTTAATIGGMIPIALALEPGAAAQAPLGTVVIGGLLSSTVLSLLVIPVAYATLAERGAQRRELARRVGVGAASDALSAK